MKKIILLPLLALAFACNKGTEDYQISGNLTGFESDETVYINKISDSNRPIIIDSTSIVNGKFKLTLPKVTTKDFNFITFSKTQGNILLIAENAKLSISGDRSDLRKVSITGGKENDIFTEFIAKISAQSNIETTLRTEGNSAAQSGNYEALKSLKLRSDSLDTARKEMRLKLITDNPQSVTSLMALSDLIGLKMIKSDEAEAHFKEMGTSLQESRLGITLRKTLESIKTETSAIGDKVSDFSAPTPTGEQLNLTKNLGKVTLLDFWASWCRPCRMENPNVVRVYNKYHDKGLEIISISLDRDADQWKQAIENDGLTWKHVSHLKFWQEPIAKKFGVRSIPAAFLLDEKGVIIGKNLRGQALEDKIKETLESL